MTDPGQSISLHNHPLAELLGAEEYAELRRAVQYCEASIPFSAVIEPTEEPDAD
jgi:hypothetical protein